MQNEIHCYLCVLKNKTIIMLIIDVKDSESIERALKRFKRKFQSTGMIKELRKRRNFEKPSVGRRNEVLNAEYRQKMYGNQ